MREPGSCQQNPVTALGQWAHTGTQEVPSEWRKSFLAVKMIEHWHGLLRQVDKSFIIGYIQKLSGYGPGQGAVGGFWIEPGRLDHMTSKGAFQCQSLCDLKPCCLCLSSTFSCVYKLLINALKISMSELAAVTAGTGKTMMKTPDGVILVEQ